MMAWIVLRLSVMLQIKLSWSMDHVKLVRSSLDLTLNSEYVHLKPVIFVQSYYLMLHAKYVRTIVIQILISWHVFRIFARSKPRYWQSTVPVKIVMHFTDPMRKGKLVFKMIVIRLWTKFIWVMELAALVQNILMQIKINWDYVLQIRAMIQIKFYWCREHVKHVKNTLIQILTI